MGRNALVDRVADPWIIVLLNLPALVIIVLAYIWAGLNEAAAIGAVALNKLPIAVVTIREGVRALDAGLDEMARVFGFSRLKRFATSSRRNSRRFSQRRPAQAYRSCGRSCSWSS